MINNSKYKKIERLKNALIDNACKDRVDLFKENYSFLSDGQKLSFRNNLMDYAMMSLSKKVIEFLISEGSLCNFANCIYRCKYTLSDKVYDLIVEMKNIHGSFTTIDQGYFSKRIIIERILDTEKVYINPDRISYIIDLINKKYFDFDEIQLVLNDFYKKSKYKELSVQIKREILLNSLDI